LNLEPREELSWKSSFEIYYGRKYNSGEQTDKDNDVVEEWRQPNGSEYEHLTMPKQQDYTSQKPHVSRLPNLASHANRKCEARMIKKGLRQHPPSKYSIDEGVLVHYPTARKHSTKRYVLKAKVLKRKLKTCKYKLAFEYPSGSDKHVTKWLSVDDITSTTIEKEQKRQKAVTTRQKERHKKIFYTTI